MTKDEQIVLLQAENALLTQKITSLEQKVVQLLQIIEKQGVKKNSSNSHNSPSQDKGKPKRNQSLRTKSQRKSGGQKGHKGHTLKMSEQPDETKILRSDYCQVCGSDLRSLRHQLVSKRQEVVIPQQFLI